MRPDHAAALRAGGLRLRGAAASSPSAVAERAAQPGRPRAIRRARLLVTCEHGGNRIPARFAEAFSNRRGPLQSHRGFDRGALDFARALARSAHAPLIAGRTSRLLVDLNRSADHPALHSPDAALSPALRAEALRAVWMPYRAAVERDVARRIDAGEQVLHLSCHSFTSMLHGRLRTADIGLLHDAARAREAALCRDWRARLMRVLPTWRIRLNSPYDGASDGLTTTLRQRYGAQHYLGIEIEINQKRIASNRRRWVRVRTLLVQELLAGERPHQRRMRGARVAH